jgi:hypothetical protein
MDTTAKIRIIVTASLDTSAEYVEIFDTGYAEDDWDAMSWDDRNAVAKERIDILVAERISADWGDGNWG